MCMYMLLQKPGLNYCAVPISINSYPEDPSATFCEFFHEYLQLPKLFQASGQYQLS